MLMAHYVHRLPADYDLGAIHQRARRRGPLWDRMPALHYKAFVLREADRLGAAAPAYGSLYLWREGQAFADFVADDRFAAVARSFGRPEIDTWTVLDARRGPVDTPRFAHVAAEVIEADAALPEILAEASARNAERARHPATLAAALGLDTRAWRLLHVTLSAEQPEAGAGTVYRILHLARPLLEALPHA